MFWILLIGTMIVSLWASAKVRSQYAKWSRVPTRSGMSGAQVASQILSRAGIHDVEILAGPGSLTDHYDPIRKRLVLSQQNYYGQSVAAAGIAAHECGHAIQRQQGYAPLQLRMAAVGVTQFVTPLTWLPLLGIPFGLMAPYTGLLIVAIAWGVIMLFNLVTLPVEFDATRRAKAILTETGMISRGEETEGMNKVLNAAAWTYVAAFITSLAFLLYYLLPLLGARNN